MGQNKNETTMFSFSKLEPIATETPQLVVGACILGIAPLQPDQVLVHEPKFYKNCSDRKSIEKLRTN